MKTIYLDSEFRCYVTNPDEKYTALETERFDGKCDTFIEGYRYIPSGESWTKSYGVVFHGEMIAPWKPFDELDAAQRQYEREKLAQYETELPQAYIDGINSI